MPRSSKVIEPINNNHVHKIVAQTAQSKVSDVAADITDKDKIENTLTSIGQTVLVSGKASNGEINPVESSRTTELPCFSLPKDAVAISPTGLAELLKVVEELVETPEQFRREHMTYDPELHDAVVIGDPRYSWEPKDKSAEFDKANAYLAELTTALNRVNYAATKLRGTKRAVVRYMERLNDDVGPLYRVVPKKAQ
jgi:hypothetical protein